MGQTNKSNADSDINTVTATADIRVVIKARLISRSVCVTLPKDLRDPLGIVEGDRLMISLDKANRRLVVTKE